MWLGVMMSLLLMGNAAAPAVATSVEQQSWGTAPDGSPVYLYTVTCGQQVARFTNYGARVVAIRTPDRKGTVGDAVLGYDTAQEYLHDKRTHLGATVGRYANRIAYGTFELQGRRYSIPVNNGQNALHGGTIGFDQRVWQGHPTAEGVDFTLVSQDGDMGFPGTLRVTVRYTLHADALRIDYQATTDKPTVINLTNHTYFNLNGDDAGDILENVVYLNADRYTPINAGLIPVGTEASVAGTPMDFRNPAAVGLRIQDQDEQLKLAGGYDHNFVLNGRSGALRIAARVYSPQSGRTLTVWTTEPGIQLYSGNFLDGSFTGRHGRRYEKHSALCLETQHFPDSPNHPGFPSTVLLPGTSFRSSTVWKFGTQAEAEGSR